MTESMLDIRESSQLLSMIAEKLGHDMILLRSGPEPCKVKCCNAVFAHYRNYDTVLVKANRKSISLKYVDSKDHLRDNVSVYDELVRFLYNALENGGYVSDGRKKLNASVVPEFMLRCVLNGF